MRINDARPSHWQITVLGYQWAHWRRVSLHSTSSLLLSGRRVQANLGHLSLLANSPAKEAPPVGRRISTVSAFSHSPSPSPHWEHALNNFLINQLRKHDDLSAQPASLISPSVRELCHFNEYKLAILPGRLAAQAARTREPHTAVRLHCALGALYI